ncbi:minichromosome maintenance protein MCM [Halopelagius fulvigenes]|uniref:DNA helicase n=1 Tax=Halopelagius fulvigenes TaxID=1198324 RepID=A0ABD5U3N9_9EURY
MSTAAVAGTEGLIDRFLAFFEKYYRDAIGTLAQRYPSEQRSLYITYDDLFTFDHALADDWVGNPETVREYADEALRLYDLPADIDLSGGTDTPAATVRLTGLPVEHTYYPGGFSPTDHAGEYVAIEGQVAKATETYSSIVEAAFVCQRCGTPTYIPQTDSGFQEPHECQGCERQGPFDVDFDDSTFIDAQKLRIEEPPEVAKGGDTSHIDVFLEDDLVKQIEPGDKVAVAGILHLEQQTANNSKTGKFRPYLDGRAITTKEAEFEDIEITDAEEERIRDIASEETDGDIFELAVDSIAPTVEEEDDIKLAIFLQLVSGVRVEMPDGTVERGDYHQLLIGDPSTGKSLLMDAAETIAPRSVSVSGHGASASGLTAAAVRDDFGDGQWTLEAGALVHAHKGLACVDELDKISPDAVKSMHKALSQQRIPVNKAGINTTLPSETALLGAANPKDGRWDPYKETHEQIDIDGALLSRFGLIWKLTDEPDEERDTRISDTMLASKDIGKRLSINTNSVGDDERAAVEPALDTEFLRKYIAYARANYTPVFRDDDVREHAREKFVTLRSSNGYDPDAAVPVTFRKLQDVHRIAEASARARLSPVIEEQDVKRAQRLVGASMRQFATNDDNEFDADITETGTSKTQKERKESLRQLIIELQGDEGPLMVGELCSEAEEQLGLKPRVTKDEVEVLCQKGEAYRPGGEGTVRVFGQ